MLRYRNIDRTIDGFEAAADDEMRNTPLVFFSFVEGRNRLMKKCMFHALDTTADVYP